MAINQAIWKINGKTPEIVKEINLEKETILEDLIQEDVSLLSDDWLIIGRQVRTDYGKNIDLLALDRNGSLIIIELKRDKTPRNVVAQGLDYASWVKKLDSTKVLELFDEYNSKFEPKKQNLNDAFLNRFKFTLSEETINQGHQIVIVCSELDPATERIVEYLNDSDVPINVIFFKVFQNGNDKFISRVWFLEPQETEDNATSVSEKVPWNGEYYVSFGESDSRNWDDARSLGFISAGGGKWYSQTLKKLEIGSRVWVNIPNTGYVGVGIVTGKPETAECIEFNGKRLSDIQTQGVYHTPERSNEDKEYIVPVEWLFSVERKAAIKELGFFGNQNTVCAPRNKKWLFTIKRLKASWKINE